MNKRFKQKELTREPLMKPGQKILRTCLKMAWMRAHIMK